MDPKCLTTLGTFSPPSPETSQKAAPHRRVFSQVRAWLMGPPQSRTPHPQPSPLHLPHCVLSLCPREPPAGQGHHCWADTMERPSWEVSAVSWAGAGAGAVELCRGPWEASQPVILGLEWVPGTRQVSALDGGSREELRFCPQHWGSRERS